MKERLSRLYKEHKITEAGLRWWIGKCGITEADIEEILAENDD